VPRTRTLILPLSTSFRPITAMYGTQSFSAVRIFFASVSEVSSRSARTPSNRLRIDRASSSWSALTGTIRICVGESQTGSIGGRPALGSGAAHADFEVAGQREAAILEELPGDLEPDHQLRFRLLDVRA